MEPPEQQVMEALELHHQSQALPLLTLEVAAAAHILGVLSVPEALVEEVMVAVETVALV
jgi:hypothetical protein